MIIEWRELASADLDRIVDYLEARNVKAAYAVMEAGRRYCTLSDAAGTRLVQLHCFEAGSPHAARHLTFRDYLRTHPEIAKAYEAEKRRAQQIHAANSNAYADAKSAWINKTEAAANRWNAAHGRNDFA